MRRKLYLLFHRLFSYFGPQHWWPGDTPLEVVVGAILTQNTSWSNAKKAIDNLKKNRLITAAGLYKLPPRKLAVLIKSAGYYNIKAQRLKEFMHFLFKNYGGCFKRISRVNLPILRRSLLSVKGIGPETADSILLYAFNKPVFVVDAYTRRILLRHGLIKDKASYAEVQNLFMKNLDADVKLFNDYHALLVRLGKEFCLKRRPKCEKCPLK